MPRRSKASDSALIDAHELALMAGVHVQTLRGYVRNGLPRAVVGGKGRPDLFDPAAALTWIEQHRPAPSSPAAVGGRAEWETRLMRAKALAGELKLKELGGLLVRRDDVEAKAIAVITELRRSLQVLARKVCTALGLSANSRAYTIIENECRELCEAFARGYPYNPDQPKEPQHGPPKEEPEPPPRTSRAKTTGAQQPRKPKRRRVAKPRAGGEAEAGRPDEGPRAGDV